MLTALVVASVLVAGHSSLARRPGQRNDAETEETSATTSPSGPGSPTTSDGASADDEAAEPEESQEPESGAETEETRPPPRPVPVLGLAEQRHRGDRLLGAVRERTAGYTSYDVTYRSRSTTPRGEESYTISGVLNVPTGRGRFPAVMLAHGYIDPAYYVRGQGMTRERGYLAARGYVAPHVDYRNHAESDDDPLYQTRMRLRRGGHRLLRRRRRVPPGARRGSARVCRSGCTGPSAGARRRPPSVRAR